MRHVRGHKKVQVAMAIPMAIIEPPIKVQVAMGMPMAIIEPPIKGQDIIDARWRITLNI